MMQLSTDHKVFIGIGLTTMLILVGGVIFITKQNERLSKPLLGQEIAITDSNHVAPGTSIQYNSNPPAIGPHYPDPAHAGMYTTPPADGNLVHSLEHGAVILWYNPTQLSGDQINTLKQIFNSTSGKTIMVPRQGMDVPVALTSWGRVLKLKTIDESQIKVFFDTNIDRGTEQAPI